MGKRQDERGREGKEEEVGVMVRGDRESCDRGER